TASVFLWAPLRSLPVPLVESGLQLRQRVVAVSAGASTEVRFSTTIAKAVRRGELVLRFVPQPRPAAMSVTVQLEAPGWRVRGGELRWRANLERTQTLRWRLAR